MKLDKKVKSEKNLKVKYKIWFVDILKAIEIAIRFSLLFIFCIFLFIFLFLDLTRIFNILDFLY